MNTARSFAESLRADIRKLAIQNTNTMRQVRRKYSRRLALENAALIIGLANQLLGTSDLRWIAYELIAAHPSAYHSLDEASLIKLSQGLDHWGTVDSFARTLAGPAWRDGLVEDSLIVHWANSSDFWQRRIALVCTVALNLRSKGGRGDVPRTLNICRLLVDDHHDMVVKAMSWALRELVVHDPQAVWDFLSAYQNRLPARVLREVKNKLATGLKNPKSV